LVFVERLGFYKGDKIGFLLNVLGFTKETKWVSAVERLVATISNIAQRKTYNQGLSKVMLFEKSFTE
jgi:hypothetical protein